MTTANLLELKQGVLAKNPDLKNRSFKDLKAIARANPEMLYPEWDFFANLIAAGRGADTKYIGLHIISHLTKIDNDRRFEKLFDVFYALLDDPSVIPASHSAAVSGLIARNLPALQARITDRLLSIESTHHAQRRKDLIKSYIIEAFDQYFDGFCDTPRKTRILEFVNKQQKYVSPKTRKRAKDFIKKWGYAA